VSGHVVARLILRALFVGFLAALLLANMAPLSAAKRPPSQFIDITTRPIDAFKIGAMTRTFGPLEFVGGLEMSSNAADLGALSAFRFLNAGGDFVGVADTGFWFYGKIDRNEQAAPKGVSQFHMVQMVGRDGKPVSKKWNVDAEGLGVRDGVAAVGFEREHRVVEYKLLPDYKTQAVRQLDFLVPSKELRQNRGFETVAFSPKDGPNEGALVVVSEKSLDKDGNIFAAVLSGPRQGVFTVKRSDKFDITDGAFLPDGDLLLLERSFSMADGVGMRLRRIPAESVGKGTVAADGPVLLQADMSFQIDNMEAMDVWRRADGATMVSLMSDDNHSMLQRNLYLEFVLHED
jgi:hypothetical protein